MPTSKINNATLYWEMNGRAGEPLVLVHGSWGDHHNWDSVAGELAKAFRVLTYDRRGHSASERLPGQGTAAEDVDDLIALIEHLGLAPAHIAGNSFGAAITLKAAAKRQDLFRSMIIHEPPLFGLLQYDASAQQALQLVNERVQGVLGLIEAGSIEEATAAFMEKIAMGPGSWEKLPEAAKRIFISNALTWYDEMQDPQGLQIDLSPLSAFRHAALLSVGGASPSFFPLVIDKIKLVMPHAERITFNGAGHVPHLSHPAEYVEALRHFCMERVSA